MQCPVLVRRDARVTSGAVREGFRFGRLGSSSEAELETLVLRNCARMRYRDDFEPLEFRVEVLNAVGGARVESMIMGQSRPETMKENTGKSDGRCNRLPASRTSSAQKKWKSQPRVENGQNTIQIIFPFVDFFPPLAIRLSQSQ